MSKRPVEEQANAWIEICGALDEAFPAWEKLPGKHLVARALAAIRLLSAPKPCAWRYRLKGTQMEWRYVDREEDANQLPCYEREAVYTRG